MQEKDSEFFWQRLSCTMLVFVLLSVQFNIAFADTAAGNKTTGAASLATEVQPPSPLQPAPDAANLPTLGTTTAPDATTPAARASFSCSNEKLDDKERQRLWDETIKKGFVGKELDAGTKPNKDRDALDKNILIIPDSKGELALKQEVPAKKIKPEEIAHLLNNYNTGAFAFGLETNDSLRAGKCTDLKDSTVPCYLLGENLKLRNSGTGIVTDVKNVFSDLSKIYDIEKVPGVTATKEKTNVLLDSIRGELIDANNTDKNISAKFAKRLKGKIIANSIFTDSFTSSMNSNCTTSDCIISSYSMFDKLFNSYFSTEMLFSNFGPTLLGQTKRAFNWAKRYSPVPGAPLGVELFGKRIPLSLREMKFYQRLKSSLYQPGSFLTDRKVARMQSIVDQYGLKFDTAIKSNYLLAQGGTFNAHVPQIIESMMKDGGDDIARRRAIWQYLKEWKDYGQALNLSREAAEQKFRAAINGVDSLSETYKAAKRTYAGKMGLLWDHVDDHTGLDIPEWFTRHKSVNWYKYAVKTQTGDFVQPAVDSHYMDRILQKFADTGDFSYTPADAVRMRSIFDNTGGKLHLYEVLPTGKEVTAIGRDGLEEVITKGQLQDVFAKLEDGTAVPFNKENLEYIMKMTQGDVKLYKGGWQKSRELSGDELADMVLGPRGNGRINAIEQNSDRLLRSATDNGFYTRDRAASLLEKAMTNDKQIIKTYLNPKGGVKWTVYPYAYWGAKRGFGSEQLSAFMLPDTWKTISIATGEQKIYNDAYIDFFSNEGSDQGDVFNQFLNYLPWKMAYDAASNLYRPLREILDKFTRNEVRSTVGNLAIYTSGSNDCQACGMTLDANGTDSFSPFFYAPEKLDTFILEDTPAKEKKVGQTLVSFTHHTNIKGKTDEIQSEDGINLEQARKNNETCLKKVEELNLGGIPVGKVFDAVGLKGASVAGGLAIAETLGYATIWWAGILGSVLQQTLITPQLQDCVDTEEGYYIHFFAPAAQAKEQKDSKDQTPASLSTEKVTDMISKGKDRITQMFKGDSNSWTNDASDKAKQSIENLLGNAEQNDIVEALLRTEGYATGQFKGTDLFMLWVQGGSELNPSSYRTEGKSVVTDGNTKVEVNFKDGIIYVNGKPIVTNPDISRLYSINTAIPAAEIPNTITKIGLPSGDSTALLFQMNARGEMFVKDSSVIDCIKQGVEEQTGVGMSSDDLTEVFGKVNAIVTDTHPNIYPDLSNNRIIAEGVPRKIAQGIESRVDILANRDTKLFESIDNDPAVGKMKSIQFKNGFILYKPETNELIVWLKRNEKAILEQNDVSGLLAKKTTSPNPENGCEEPAIDLEAQGYPDSEISMQKVELFNQSLKKMGPFKIFDTPTKRFIFYSKLENGKCRDYFKVIDKKTGEVLVDQPIDSIQQTPDGVRITTADGKTHDLGFSAENGRPIINYNGIPELLQSAQGPNGAFWFDPDKGQWYAENAQLLPLLEAFKNKGILTQANPDGSVKSVPGSNPLNINIGQGAGAGFTLPSLPENLFLLAIYLASMVAVITLIRRNSFNKKFDRSF